MYETPPNFSLFGDQWHFMMRALNFNAFPSPTSLLFFWQHTYCVSDMEKLPQFLFFNLPSGKFCMNRVTPWSFPWSPEPVILWEEIASRKSSNQFSLSFCQPERQEGSGERFLSLHISGCCPTNKICG